jgi:RNA polymerase sigma-70 factor (ECF subfamily)
VELSDSDLIARVLLDDDHHAFGELVKRHQSAVRATLRKLTAGNETLADELAQETFLKAYRSLGKFRGEAKFSTWLYRIAYNVFQSDARAAKYHEQFDEAAHAEPQAPTTDAVDFQHDLDAALSRLSEKERAAVTLCYTSGLTHEEAAEALQWPLGTLKTNILTGKEKLRRYLAPWQNRRLT